MNNLEQYSSNSDSTIIPKTCYCDDSKENHDNVKAFYIDIFKKRSQENSNVHGIQIKTIFTIQNREHQINTQNNIYV